MTKSELKNLLLNGSCLKDLFHFTDGQDCLIYKGDFEATENIVYIPDIFLNEIDIESTLDDEAIENAVHHCCTGKDFIQECNGNVDLAKELFGLVDWQHPDLQDLLDGYDEDTFFERYGVALSEIA